MDYYQDQHFKYSIKADTIPEINYPIINWCKQFLNLEGTFVDIGAEFGAYTINLAKYCKDTYSFEADPIYNDCLAINIVNANLYRSNNIDNLNAHEVDLKNVCFLRINHDNYDLIKLLIPTLEENNFPCFIIQSFGNKQTLDLITNLGYSVQQVRGANNLFLACDHQVINNYFDIPNTEYQIYEGNKFDSNYDYYPIQGKNFYLAKSKSEKFDKVVRLDFPGLITGIKYDGVFKINLNMLDFTSDDDRRIDRQFSYNQDFKILNNCEYCEFEPSDDRFTNFGHKIVSYCIVNNVLYAGYNIDQNGFIGIKSL